MPQPLPRDRSLSAVESDDPGGISHRLLKNAPAYPAWQQAGERQANAPRSPKMKPRMKMDRCGKNVIKELEALLGRRPRRPIEDPAHVHAAVIVPLFNKDGVCHILFTRRTQEVKHHKGQISFPGGAFDEEDRDLR